MASDRGLRVVTDEDLPIFVEPPPGPPPPRRRRSAKDIVPFGQYRGRPLPELLADIPYCAWLLEQPWMATKYPAIRGVVQAAVTAYETEGAAVREECPMSPRQAWLALSADRRTAVRVCAPELARALEAGEDPA